MTDHVAAVLTNADVKTGDINHVFLALGTSQTPAVQNIFAELVGVYEMRGGGVFSSVAGGLAALAGVGLVDLAILIALRELGAEDWALVRRVIG